MKSQFCMLKVSLKNGKFLPGDFIENSQYLLCDSSYQYETLGALFAERYLQQTDNALQVDKKVKEINIKCKLTAITLLHVK